MVPGAPWPGRPGPVPPARPVPGFVSRPTRPRRCGRRGLRVGVRRLLGADDGLLGQLEGARAGAGRARRRGGRRRVVVVGALVSVAVAVSWRSWSWSPAFSSSVSLASAAFSVAWAAVTGALERRRPSDRETWPAVTVWPTVTSTAATVPATWNAAVDWCTGPAVPVTSSVWRTSVVVAAWSGTPRRRTRRRPEARPGPDDRQHHDDAAGEPPAPALAQPTHGRYRPPAGEAEAAGARLTAGRRDVDAGRRHGPVRAVRAGRPDAVADRQVGTRRRTASRCTSSIRSPPP